METTAKANHGVTIIAKKEAPSHNIYELCCAMPNGKFQELTLSTRTKEAKNLFMSLCNRLSKDKTPITLKHVFVAANSEVQPLFLSAGGAYRFLYHQIWESSDIEKVLNVSGTNLLFVESSFADRHFQSQITVGFQPGKHTLLIDFEMEVDLTSQGMYVTDRNCTYFYP